MDLRTLRKKQTLPQEYFGSSEAAQGAASVQEIMRKGGLVLHCAA